MQKLAVLSFVVAGLISLQGCQNARSQEVVLNPTVTKISDEPRNPKPSQPQIFSEKLIKDTKVLKDELAIVGALNLASLPADSPNGNKMISPISVSYCLGMLRLGASGASAWDIDGFLMRNDARSGAPKLPSPMDYGAMLGDLHTSLKPMIESDTLHLANGAWIAKNFTLKPKFKENVEDIFSVKVAQTSFPNPGEAEINGFVNKQTRGKIPKLIDDTNDLTTLVLVNAVSFLDRWVLPFKPENTQKEQFTLPDGTKIQHDAMHYRSMKADYGAIGATQAIKLWFQSGFSMIIVLGIEGSSPEDALLLMPKLRESMAANQSKMLDRFVDLQLPKWTSEFTWDIKKQMQSLGFTAPFSQEANDFAGITNEPLSISNIIQKTYIKVNEEGAEAAAATAAVAAGLGREDIPPKPIPFIVNRPFAYTIQDTYGIPFFMGVVNDQTK